METESSTSLNFALQVLETDIPKQITQQAAFLEKYPEYDGRGIKIAILDTGVDPSCPGLQKTTDGKPKIIDCRDLTGAGDVDTSTIKKADENGILIGLTERELKIPKSWTNPSEIWHLGKKVIYELYSPATKERITGQRNKELHEKNIQLLHGLQKQLADNVKNNNMFLSDHDKKDLEAKFEHLKEIENISFESPVADCIVWFDGKRWKACIDLSFTGDLENAKVMSSYHENYEYGFISNECKVTYSFNISDDGNLLEICVPNGSHGTHVAHIAAGHFPDCPEKDGLAPGAQIVSLCVGDSRKGTALTCQAFLRALNKCIELKVDIINFSFGAFPNGTDSGNIGKVITEVVQKYGIIFVAAAGNDGPCFSTMGFAGGEIHHSIIYVGAYLTSEMKKMLYGFCRESPSLVFPFSSRGPCTDGTVGVCISAPGAAITGIPKHCLKNSDLMEGTSMAAPNAVGNIACLLSGMKVESIPISPFRLKLALMNSAKMPEDGSHHPLSLGAGIIQILSAFELIKSSMNSIPANITDIKVNINSKRGIYFREWLEVFQKDDFYDFFVEVQTIYNEEDVQSRANFECPIQLKLLKESDTFVKLPNASRLPEFNFFIQIQLSKLQKETINFVEIIGINPENPLLGPLFRIPVTVIIPATVSSESNYCYKKELTLEAAIPRRLFLKTPMKSTYVKVTVESQEQIKFDFQLVCVGFKQMVKTENNAVITPNDSKYIYCSIPDNTVIEICVTPRWTCSSSSTVNFKADFFGFSVEPTLFFSTSLINDVRFMNRLRHTEIQPVVEFMEWVYPINPVDAIIESMKERDTINGNPSFRLLLAYEFNAQTSNYFKFGQADSKFYNAHFDCYLLQISTKSKKHLLTTSHTEQIYLEKGEYIIHIQIRTHASANDDRDLKWSLLENLKYFPLMVMQPIILVETPKIITDSKNCITVNGEMIYKKLYGPGETGVFYVPNCLPFPSIYPSGSYLKGTICLQNTIETKEFSSFDVVYSLANTVVPIHNSNEHSYNNDFNESENKLIDYEISEIMKCGCSNKAYILLIKLLDKHSNKFPILAAAIQMAYEKKDLFTLSYFVKALKITASRIHCDNNFVNAGLFALTNLALDEILKSTTNDIPDAFRNGFDPVMETDIEQNATTDEPKENFIEKAMKSDQLRIERIAEKAFADYMLFVDPTSENARVIKAKYSVAHERYGIALSELKKIITDKTTTSDYLSTEKAIIQILKKLDWDHLAEEAQKTFLIKHPKFYRLF